MVFVCAGISGTVAYQRDQQQRLRDALAEFHERGLVIYRSDGKQRGKRVVSGDVRNDVLSVQVADVSTDELQLLSRLTGLEALAVSTEEAIDLSPLASLTKLESLQVESPRIRNVSAVTKMTGLELLYLKGRVATDDLKPLAGLTGMKHLTVVRSKVTDLSPLAKMKDLKDLQFGGGPITDLTPLQGLKKLRFVRIAISPDGSTAAPWPTPPPPGAILFINGTPVPDLAPLAALPRVTVIRDV